MRYDLQAAVTDWHLLEVVRKKRRPCSDAYSDSANEQELADIFHELRLLCAAGQPPDTDLGLPKVQKVGKCEFSQIRRKVDVYVLKAKPSGWRLYFYVRNREQREIEFLYAVHKKNDKRDPADLAHCETILIDVLGGRTSCEPLFIPDR